MATSFNAVQGLACVLARTVAPVALGGTIETLLQTFTKPHIRPAHFFTSSNGTSTFVGRVLWQYILLLELEVLQMSSVYILLK